MSAPDPSEYPRLSLEGFLDQVAAPSPAPGGGAVAAVATALAASLCSMAARKSPSFPGGGAAAGIADARRRQALCLATEDALAYRRVLDAQRAVAASGFAEPAGAAPLLSTALAAAADVPLELAGIGAEISALANDLVVHGSPHLVGDSLAAALLAASAAEAAAALVAINVAGMPETVPGDDRTERASALADRAESAARRARAAAEVRLREP